MSALFCVSLVAFKVVNGGADLIPLFLARANSIHRVAHHLKRLEGNHDFVVLNKIAGEQQQLCGFHLKFLRGKYDALVGRHTLKFRYA
jgi:hypothetical protein